MASGELHSLTSSSHATPSHPALHVHDPFAVLHEAVLVVLHMQDWLQSSPYRPSGHAGRKKLKEEDEGKRKK